MKASGRTLSILMSIALVMGLMPSPAYAEDDLFGEDAGLAVTRLSSEIASPDLGKACAAKQGQSAKKTVYVLTKAKSTAEGSSESYSYSYDKNGLLARQVRKGKDSSDRYVWGYSDKGFLKFLKTYWNGSSSPGEFSNLSANKSGVLTKESYYSNGGTFRTTNTYKVSSGRITSAKEVSYHLENGAWVKEAGSRQYKFAYKNGRLINARTSSLSGKCVYAYDKKGNLKQMKWAGGVCAFANSYDKKGRLKTSVEKKKYPGSNSYSSYQPVRAYSYKAIKVNASMVSRVKKQQWALLNRNLNFTIGGIWNPGILCWDAFGMG